MTMKLLLNGVDISHYVDLLNMQVGDTDISAVVSTASALVEDYSRTLPMVPTIGQEVKIYDDDGVTIIFGGQLAEIELMNLAGPGRSWMLHFQDWNECLLSSFLERHDTYVYPQSDRDLVIHMMWEGLSKTFGGLTGFASDVFFTGQTLGGEGGLGLPNHPVRTANDSIGASWVKVKGHVSFTSSPFDYTGMTLKAALDKLASLIPGVFYKIGPDKKLTWDQPNVEAPWIVSTTPSGTYAYLFENYNEHWIRGQQATKYRLDGASAQQYAYDEATAAVYGGVAGGGVRDLAYTVDSSITNAGVLQQRAYAALVSKGQAREVKFSVYQRGLSAGMLIPLVNKNLADLGRSYPGISSAYLPFGYGGVSNSQQLTDMRAYLLITKVRDVPLGNGAHRYDVTAGDYVRDLPLILAGV